MNAKLIQEIAHFRGGLVVDPLLPVAKKRRLADSRTSASTNATHVAKIGMVAIAMKSNIAVQHVPTTLVDCAKFIDKVLEGGGTADLMEDVVVSRYAIGRELLLVADALQLYLRDRMQGLRDRYLFVGVGF